MRGEDVPRQPRLPVNPRDREQPRARCGGHTGMQGAESLVWIGHVQPLRDPRRVACRRAAHHAKG